MTAPMRLVLILHLMAVTPKNRFAILERDWFACKYCWWKPPFVQLEIDHIIPKSKWGKDTIENLITSCSICNIGKWSKILWEQEDNFWKKKLERKVQEHKAKFYDQWNLSRLWEVDKKTTSLVAIYFSIMIKWEDWENYHGYLGLPTFTKTGVILRGDEYNALEKEFMLWWELCDEVLEITASSSLDINSILEQVIDDSMWMKTTHTDYSSRLNYCLTEELVDRLRDNFAVKRFTLYPELF